MPSPHHLRILLPAATLVAVILTGLGVSYYFASADSSAPSVTWSTGPLFITFASKAGSGSAPDSFTCNPTVSPVTLQAFSNQPDIITLTVTPSSFPSCGSTPDNVVVTATCNTTAQSHQSCAGDYSGKVFVCGPTPYTCLKKTLIVIITVTKP